MTAKEAARERRRTKTLSPKDNVSFSQINGRGTYLLTASPIKHTVSLPSHDSFDAISPMSPGKVWFDDYNRDNQALGISTMPRLPRVRPESGDVEMALGERGENLSEENLSRHDQRTSINHLVYKFTSPIGE
jgi:hypothetical protein